MRFNLLLGLYLNKVSRDYPTDVPRAPSTGRWPAAALPRPPHWLEGCEGPWTTPGTVVSKEEAQWPGAREAPSTGRAWGQALCLSLRVWAWPSLGSSHQIQEALPALAACVSPQGGSQTPRIRLWGRIRCQDEALGDGAGAGAGTGGGGAALEQAVFVPTGLTSDFAGFLGPILSI